MPQHRNIGWFPLRAAVFVALAASAAAAPVAASDWRYCRIEGPILNVAADGDPRAHKFALTVDPATSERVELEGFGYGYTDCSEFLGEPLDVSVTLPREDGTPRAGDRVAFILSGMLLDTGEWSWTIELQAYSPRSRAIPPMAPADVLAKIRGDDPPQVLDVRTPEEFAAGHVPGAVLIPHDQLAARLAELDRERPVLVYCRSGRRSTLAEDVLIRADFAVRQIDGSWQRWQAEGLPTEITETPR